MSKNKSDDGIDQRSSNKKVAMYSLSNLLQTREFEDLVLRDANFFRKPFRLVGPGGAAVLIMNVI